MLRSMQYALSRQHCSICCVAYSRPEQSSSHVLFQGIARSGWIRFLVQAEIYSDSRGLPRQVPQIARAGMVHRVVDGEQDGLELANVRIGGTVGEILLRVPPKVCESVRSGRKALHSPCAWRVSVEERGCPLACDVPAIAITTVCQYLIAFCTPRHSLKTIKTSCAVVCPFPEQIASTCRLRVGP